MKGIRLLAASTIGLVAICFGFRAVVARCSGAGCDVYIPFSLLLPLAILVLTAITGFVSSLRARGSVWFPLLVASAAISVIGPLVALAVFRDRPDAFVFGATTAALVAPVVALTYSVIAHRQIESVTE